MAKQLNVNLAMTADTSKAKAQLQDLQKQLDNLIKGANSGAGKNFILTKEIEDATVATAKLKSQLDAATNVNTGKLDLGKFTQSMKQGDMSLKKYQEQLHNLGPAGDKAFASLAQSISSAEVPLRRSNALVSEMWTTLQNSARWQISSSAIHGFMGALQSAYGYAQDLNQSLNDIRIVTGYGADSMDRFAEKANTAAKALSSSTLDYTNAALIYYQQGLNAEEVEKRTAVTLKMANTAGISAETASEQLTAIWNNFDDGSKSLEHYADVLVRLGADTASSSDEISEGLEKFAAIGATIGLSYENAAAALATVTATTRQSADVVGTAFKTIFARIQGLNLGETLDDGTTLNKYSKALQSVGISIKDQTGQLKDMDTILAEMGDKWSTLNKDQQVALAQTVAGVRQYTQLTALMDNWDFYEKNLTSAQNADGALSVQADIYAQSWEASKERVKAAAEDIYDSLIDDDFFIELNNSFASMLTGLGEIIDGMGGLKGVLLMVGSVALTVFRDQISQGTQNVIYNMKMLTTAGRESIDNTRKEANNLLISGSVNDGTAGGAAKADAYKNQGQLQNTYLKAAKKMNEEQKKTSQLLLDQQQRLIKNVELRAEETNALEKQAKYLQRKNLQGIDDAQIQKVKDLQSQFERVSIAVGQYNKGLEQIGHFDFTGENIEDLKAQAQVWLTSLEGVDILGAFGADAEQALIAFNYALQDATISGEELNERLNKLFSSASGNEDINDIADELENAFIDGGLNAEQARERVENLRSTCNDLGGSYQELNQQSSLLNDYTDKVRTQMEGLSATTTLDQQFMAVASSIGNVISIGEAFKSMLQAWNNQDLSFGEKLSATFSALMMMIPSVTTLLNAENVATLLVAASKNKLTMKVLALMGAKVSETGAVVANTVAWYANPIMWIAVIIAGVVAAIALLTAGIMAATEALIKGDKIENEHAETLIENAEKTKELAESNRDLETTMEDLISSYEELNRAGENSNDVLNDIKSNIPSLIDSYEELAKSVSMSTDKIKELESAANLGVLTGDFSKFNEQKAELDKELAIATKDSAKMASEAATKNLALDIQQDGGGKYNSDTGKLNLTVGGVATKFDSDGKSEESKAQEILLNNMEGYANKTGALHGVELGANINSSTEFVDYYEKMVAARDEMLATMSTAEINSSDIFREINKAIEAGAESYTVAKEQADEYIAVAGEALKVELGDGSNIESMKEYLAYRDKYIATATEQYGLTKEQAEAYLEESASLSNVAQQYQLATTMAEKFGYIDTDSAEFEGVADQFYEEMSKVYGELSEEELEVAIAVANSVETIDDFSEQFQIAMIESSRQGFETSASTAAEVMKKASEDGTVDMSSLLNDENFIAHLEQVGITQQELTTKNYEELYSIVSDFYNKCNMSAFESFEAEQDLYHQHIAEKQGELSAYYAAISGENAAAVTEAKDAYREFQEQLEGETDENEIRRIKMDMDELAQKFKEDYGFEITSNADTLNSEIDSLLDKINELQDQKIEMAMDWSGTDEIANSMKQAAEFARSIKDETKKVGENYTMTAEQLREWCKVYPELGSMAKTTNEGIIQMNAAEVDAFIDGKEQELAADVDAKIEQLKAQKAVLEEDLKTKQVELNAAKALAEGKINLEDVSAEYIVGLRGNLTQYFMDLGMDEQTANAAALETMGLNEEEYAKLVQDACETNAENQAISAENGANAQAASITEVVKRWGNFGKYLINNIGPLLKEIGAAILDPTRTVKDVMKDAWDASAITIDKSGNKEYTTTSGDYTFNSGDESQITAALQEVAAPQLEQVQTQIDEINDAIGSVDGQISYLEGIKNQGLENLGETDINEVDGTNDAKKAEKEKKKKEEKEKKDKEKFDYDSSQLKNLDNEIERYHEIENTLDVIDDELSDIARRKENAHGAEKVAIIEEETEALKKQAAAQEEYINQIKRYLDSDKSALDKYGAQYDKDGNLTNYDEMVQSQIDKYNDAYDAYHAAKNAAVDAYNASAKDEAAEAAYTQAIKNAEAYWDAAQASYEGFLDDVDQYEETLDLLRDAENELEDIYQTIEKLPEELEFELKVKFEVEEDELKKLDEEIERYHTIQGQLDDIADELENIQKEKDRAFGKNKIDAINKETKALEKQLETQKKYQKEIKKNLETDKKALSKYGATFDENGNVSNYESLMEQQVNQYDAAYKAYIAEKNAAVDAYNNGYGEEEDQEAYDKAIEAAEEKWKKAQDAYSDFQDDLSQYEESVDLFEESEQTLRDIENQLYDLKLEKVSYSVQLKIDVADDELEYLDYLISKLDNDAYDAADGITLLGQKVAESMDKISAYKEGLSGIFGNHGLTNSTLEAYLSGDADAKRAVESTNFTEEEMAKIREYRSAILSENQTLMALRQEVRDKVMPAFDELTEEMDKQISKIEHLQSVTESYRNIIDIVGKDYLGISDAMMNSLTQAQVDMAVDNLAATKAKLDGMTDSRAEAQKAFNAAKAAGDEDLAKFWQKTLDEIDEKIRDAESDYMSSWETALQKAADAFQESIETSIKNFTDTMAGAAGSLEALEAEFERSRKEKERYLPDYKQEYELSKLTRDIYKSIEETDNVKAKGEYKKLIEEINDIEKSGEEISEYKLQHMQKEFELKQAELALEEAKNSKSQVRMTRDNEGNWGYVYTADEDNIESAMQNYEDKLFALNDLAYQYAQEQEAALVQLQGEFADAIRNIQAEVGSDEWYAEVEKITEFYKEQNSYHLSELGLALDDAGLHFSDTTLATKTGFDTMQGYQEAFNTAVGNPTQPNSLLGQLDTAYQTWKNNTEIAMNAAGVSTENFATVVDTETQKAKDDVDETARKTEEMAERMDGAFGEVTTAVQKWEEEYGREIDKAIKKNEEMVTSLNGLLAAQSLYDEEQEKREEEEEKKKEEEKRKQEEEKSKLEKEKKKLEDEIAQLEKELQDKIGKLRDEEAQLREAIDLLREQLADLEAQLENLKRKLEENTPKDEPSTGGHTTGPTPSPSPSPSPSPQNDPSSDGVLNVGDSVTYVGGTYYADSYGGGRTGNRGPGKSVTVTQIKEDGRPYPIHVTSTDSAFGWLKKSQLSGFDTGGYTGSWGPEGRLALLHQKELVLNAHDTDNMLQIVDCIRDISRTLELNATSASRGLDSILQSPGQLHNKESILQQEVTIHAEFPNAQNRTEIEEAFHNLINMASQYANREHF